MDKVWLFVVEKVNLLWTLLKCTSESQLGESQGEKADSLSAREKKWCLKKGDPQDCSFGFPHPKGPFTDLGCPQSKETWHYKDRLPQQPSGDGGDARTRRIPKF